MRFRILFLLLFSGCFPAFLPAQSLPTVIPGQPALEIKKLKSEALEYTMYAVASGVRTDMGTYTHRLVVDKNRGTVTRIQQIQIGTQKITDTTICKLKDLMPVYHSSRSSGRVVQIRWDRTTITGSFTANGVTTPIQSSLQQPAFEAGMHDVVLRFLHLEEGYAPLLAVYDFEGGGPIWYQVEKTEATEYHQQACWLVTVRTDDNKNRIWIDQKTRRVYMIQTIPAESYSVYLELKP